MTTNTNEQNEGVQAAPRWAWGGFATLLLLLILMGGIRSCNSTSAETKAEKQTRKDSIAAARTVAVATALATPLNRCTTPCDMYVGWDIAIKTSARPALVKFYGKSEWIRLSGREDDVVPLDKFSPGVAQFRAESAPPVPVELYRAK